MGFTKEETSMLGFEIVAYAGDARAKLLKALQLAETGEWDKVDSLLEEANDLIVEAHKTQTKLLQAEASGESIDLSFIMIHGQDHLMTTILLKDVMQTLLCLMKKN